MADRINREIHLASRPHGWPTPANFRLVETPLPEAADGQVLVRNVYMSVDPYMRGYMNARSSYGQPHEVGHALFGGAIGRVVVSHTPALAVGDVVLSNWGWRDYFASDGSDLERIEPQAPLSSYLGVLGMTGLTAYVGLYELAEPQPGETVLVSAASGAVGSVVGQLARLRGCTVIGSAGSEEKVRYVRDDLGFDAAFNYRVTSPEQALADLAPEGIDVYFDNVGGDHLQAALGAMRLYGRITICGMISLYNATAPEPGPNNLILILTRRLRLQGFTVLDYADRQAACREAVGGYLRAGRLIARETIVDGIERAPGAFLAMMRGEHIGKMCVRLAPDLDGA